MYLGLGEIWGHIKNKINIDLIPRYPSRTKDTNNESKQNKVDETNYRIANYK